MWKASEKCILQSDAEVKWKHMEISLRCVWKQERILSSQLESVGSLRSTDPSTSALSQNRIPSLHKFWTFQQWFCLQDYPAAYFCLRASSCSLSSTPRSSGQLKAGCLGVYGVSHSQENSGNMPLSIALAQSFLSSCVRLDALG